MKIKFFALFALIFFMACAPAARNQVVIPGPGPQTNLYASEQEYKLQPGDSLDIKFFYNQELNEQVIVRPDGRISLQLVREIRAAGLTPEELTNLLIKKYSAELLKPEITVIVRSFGGYKVYIDGEVNRVGMVNMSGPTTVMQSIAQAGGLKETARVNEIIVIRYLSEGNYTIIPIDMEKVIDGTDFGQNILLKPFDIVHVPRSIITNINIWVDQYIRKNVPIPFSVYYGFNTNN
jgi:protein involved in polysaccharide export with SLBB domain